MSVVHWDLIDPKTAGVLRAFGKTQIRRDFYLSGGTALSLQLGHRISLDLDFFTKTPQHKLRSQTVLSRLEQHFGLPKVSISYRAVDQIWLSVDGVKVTFLAYPFKRKYPLVACDEICLADARDIALQKAFSVGRRATARDYVDLAWILKSGLITIGEIIRNASEVFNQEGEPLFSEKLFLQQLVYTEDLEDKDAVLRLLRVPYDFDSLMKELREAVRSAAQAAFLPASDETETGPASPSPDTTAPTSRRRTPKSRARGR